MKNRQKAEKYFIKIAYQGTLYAGWQRQPSLSTVQSVLEANFAKIGYPTTVVGSGRTDAGVHALGQVAHLELPSQVDTQLIQKSVNALLPNDIAIHAFQKVSPHAHARFDAVARKYQYCIALDKDPFHYRRSYYYPYPLDIIHLNSLAEALLGKHDFTSFCKKKSIIPKPICDVTEAYWAIEGKILSFFIRANRFLHHMVRTAIGTMLMLVREQKDASALAAILVQKDRTTAGPTAPPEGLCLLEVTYPTAYMNN